MPATHGGRVAPRAILCFSTPAATVESSVLGTASSTAGSRTLRESVARVELAPREGVGVRGFRGLVRGAQAARLGQAVGTSSVGTQQHPEDFQVYDRPGQRGGDGGGGGEVAATDVDVT